MINERFLKISPASPPGGSPSPHTWDLAVLSAITRISQPLLQWLAVHPPPPAPHPPSVPGCFFLSPFQASSLEPHWGPNKTFQGRGTKGMMGPHPPHHSFYIIPNKTSLICKRYALRLRWKQPPLSTIVFCKIPNKFGKLYHFSWSRTCAWLQLWISTAFAAWGTCLGLPGRLSPTASLRTLLPPALRLRLASRSPPRLMLLLSPRQTCAWLSPQTATASCQIPAKAQPQSRLLRGQKLFCFFTPLWPCQNQQVFCFSSSVKFGKTMWLPVQ